MRVQKLRKFMRLNLRGRCTGYEKAKDLSVQHPHVFGAVGLDHIALQHTRAILIKVIGDDAGNLAP